MFLVEILAGCIWKPDVLRRFGVPAAVLIFFIATNAFVGDPKTKSAPPADRPATALREKTLMQSVAVPRRPTLLLPPFLSEVPEISFAEPWAYGPIPEGMRTLGFRVGFEKIMSTPILPRSHVDVVLGIQRANEELTESVLFEDLIVLNVDSQRHHRHCHSRTR